LTAEEQFLEELDVFREGAEAASQYLYAYLTIDRLARERQRVRQHVGENATFWLTVQSALQISLLMALHRVFDQQSAHNLDRLIRLAERHRLGLFSRAALARRKSGGGPDPSWLTQYVSAAHEPTVDDIRELRRRVAGLRRVYEPRYRDLRHVHAHTKAASATEIAQLFARTRVAELQQLVVALLALHEALWQLFWNGVRPLVRKMRSSARPVRGLDAWSPVTTSRPHERIVLQAERVLREASRPAPRRQSSRAPRR
jgi:HEPN superfamily AbiU2-like protein